MIRPIAVCALLLLPFANAGAQERIVFRGGLTITQMRAHTRLPPQLQLPDEALGAASLGLDATLARGRFGVAFSYLHSDLAPRLPGATDRDAAEGELLLTAAIRPWLSVAGGFHARSYRTDLGRQRWAMWEARLRLETATLPVNGRAHFLVWPVLLGRADNVPERWRSGFGSEAGFTWSPPRAPVWVRVAYRAEFFRLADGRSELTDGVRLTAGFALSR